MNKYIKEQLNKTKICKIPPFNNDTTSIKIPKHGVFTEAPLVEVEEFYLIKLKDYIINPPKDFNFHDNWNNGSIPTQSYYKCKCIKKLGKMIFVLGVGFDFESKKDLDDIIWDGWLPLNSIEVIAKL